MSRAESAKKLQEILNDELCTLVACRQAMERVKEPGTVAELRHIASRHEDSISHLRAAIIDRAEEPNDDAQITGPWKEAAKELSAATQSATILAVFRKTENLCRERGARAAATVGLLDETARRMVSELILPRHNESLTTLDKFLQDRLTQPDKVANRVAAHDKSSAAKAPREGLGKNSADDPHLFETLKDIAGQVAKAGLMAGIYGAAVVTKPLRYVWRRGVNLIAPTLA